MAGRLTFSAALCRGLIEATVRRRAAGSGGGSFPRLYAAASLKLQLVDEAGGATNRFPRLYAAASLKPPAVPRDDGRGGGFPRLYAAASLKPVGQVDAAGAVLGGFPRLYAAASLKRSHFNTRIDKHSSVFRGFMPRPH